MFHEFKQKIAKDYTILTTILLLCVSIIIYFVEFSISYKEQLHQLNMLAIEESEEIFYKLNTNTIEEFNSIEQLPNNDNNYFNRIFIYAYNIEQQPLFVHNNIAWSKEPVENMIFNEKTPLYEVYFHFKFVDNRYPKAFISVHYPLIKDNQNLGDLYTGIDITHWIREQARIFIILLFVILFSMIFIRYLSFKMADKAMVPVVKSFEQEKQFIANASHELSTPLSIIMTGITVLKTDENNQLSSFSKDIIEDINDESLRMKNLINNLLLIARSDNNTLKLNPIEFPLKNLLIKLHNKFSLLSSLKNISLDFQGEIPDISIYADFGHIEQILTILLDNAIKYTDNEGKITLNIQNQKHDVIINVKDTGKGISSEDLPHIFERFYRADKARSLDGNGLGLSIAQTLASYNHCQITVQSSLNEGSCFSLVIKKYKY